MGSRIPSRRSERVALWGVVGYFLAVAAWGGVAPTWLFFEEPPTPSLRAAIEQRGARIRAESRWFNALSVLAEETTLTELLRLPSVVGSAPVRRFVFRFPREEVPAAPAQTGTAAAQRALVEVDRLHAKGLTGSGVRVGVLDTGFRTTHRAFRGLHVGATYDFLHNDPVVHDEAGQDDGEEDFHGTEVLGILGGNLPGEFVGVAPLAEYYLAKTEDVSEKGREVEVRAEEDTWIAGLEWCVAQGCRVVNSSLGYSAFYSFLELDGQTALVTRAAEEAFRRGTLVVNAAGNSNGVPPRDQSLRGRIAPPADGAHVLAVGSATADGSPSNQSAQGPTFDGRIKPDGLAPGVDVVTVLPADESTFVRVTGTSIATPFVTGIVALLMEAFPQATVQDYLDALRATASWAHSPNPRAGYGVFKGEAAYAYLAARYTPTATRRRALVPSEWGRLKRDALKGVLWAPYPNPARAILNVPLSLRDAAFVRVGVFDGSGRVVYSLVEGVLDAGTYTLHWEGQDQHGALVASGVYRVAGTFPEATYVRTVIWRRE